MTMKFRKTYSGQYIVTRTRPSATCCNEKCSVLNEFCYGEVLAYYTLQSKSNKTCEYEPNELNDNLIQNSY